MSEGLLSHAVGTLPPGNILEIRHAAAPVVSPEFLCSSSGGFADLISLNRGRKPFFDQPAVCDTASLPFQDGVFSTVLLHHVISRGTESELGEAVRVLTRDGILLIMGLNRLGLRFRSQGRLRRLPGLSPLKVKAQLDHLDMTLQGFAGAGIFGLKRPLFTGSGMAVLCTPFADVMLLRVRHSDGPETTPIKLGKLHSRVVQSA